MNKIVDYTKEELKNLTKTDIEVLSNELNDIKTNFLTTTDYVAMSQVYINIVDLLTNDSHLLIDGEELSESFELPLTITLEELQQTYTRAQLIVFAESLKAKLTKLVLDYNMIKVQTTLDLINLIEEE